MVASEPGPWRCRCHRDAYYKHSRIKQYLKDGRALRIETVITLDVRPSTRAFTQGTATWLQAGTGTAWTTPGGDAGSVGANPTSVSGRRTSFGYTTSAQASPPGASIPGAAYLNNSLTDTQGKTTTATYDGMGLVSSITPPAGTGGVASVNRYQGESGVSCGGRPGQVCSSADGNGHSTVARQRDGTTGSPV